MTAPRVQIAALCLLASASCSYAAEVALAPFYANVATMAADGPLGTVVAKEPVATSIPGAQAWRIAYVSSDLRDKKTLSTALVIAQTGDAPAGGRPILAWAHGTTGTAQNCGPSQERDPAQDFNQYFLVGGTSSTDFGVPAATQFIQKGYVLVATDYQGLGGGGVHQYAIAASNGRDVINSVRAVGSIGLSGMARKAVIYGWSQGGGATLAAAGQPDYINRTGTAFDGISFAGFVGLAPDDVATLLPPNATEDAAAQKVLTEIAKVSAVSAGNFAHYAMNIWAMPAAFPELKLTDLLTEDGAHTINGILSKKCMHVGADTINFALGDNFMAIVREQPDNSTAWVKALREGSVPAAAPVAPVVIYFGNKDVTVDPEMHKLYQQQACTFGGNVTRIQLPGEQNHFTTPPVSQQFFVSWIEDRFAGKPLENGCPAP